MRMGRSKSRQPGTPFEQHSEPSAALQQRQTRPHGPRHPPRSGGGAARCGPRRRRRPLRDRRRALSGLQRRHCAGPRLVPGVRQKHGRLRLLAPLAQLHPRALRVLLPRRSQRRAGLVVHRVSHDPRLGRVPGVGVSPFPGGPEAQRARQHQRPDRLRPRGRLHREGRREALLQGVAVCHLQPAVPVVPQRGHTEVPEGVRGAREPPVRQLPRRGARWWWRGRRRRQDDGQEADDSKGHVEEAEHQQACGLVEASEQHEAPHDVQEANDDQEGVMHVVLGRANADAETRSKQTRDPAFSAAMASKAAATRGAAPSAPADAPPLCALVVLTPFHAGERTLAPLAVPPALLPVADRAAADYAIEWVLAGGADEVVVAWAGEPGGEVDAWFRSSPYASHPTPIRPLPLPTCASLGDLLREADRMELFRGPDVLLVRSAVCAPGLDPKALVARHRERKRNDPKVIMTSVWSPRSEGRQGKAVVVGEGGKLLHLGQPGEGVVKVPLETVEERGGTGEWEVSVGHEPAGVEVCEMNVLALFTENFDHGRLYAHLVPEVLDSEVLDHSFYVEFADFARGEYARRLVGTASWYQICTDVLARRTFPFVPDVPWHPDSAPCTFHPAVGTYIGDPPAGQPHWESRPNQTTSYVPYSPSGPPPQTTSLRSSLLHTPDVGPGTRISRSLVLPGASIGADCSLDLCVVGPGAAVADGTTVRGATLGAGSKVGPGTVGAGIVVSASQAEVLEDDEEEEGWEAYGLGYEHPGQEDGESDDDGGSDSDGGSVSGAMARLDLGKLVGRSAAPTAAQVRRAREELRSTVRRAIAEGHAAEDCFAELKTAKMAENVGWGEVRAAVCVEVAEAAVKEGGKKAGERWADLMGMVILERTKKEDGKEVVMLIADHIATHPNPAALSTKTLVPLLKALYDADAIEEDHVLGWWNASGARKRGAKDSHGAEVGEAHEKARAGVEPLVRWLMEAEEESEESDESG